MALRNVRDRKRELKNATGTTLGRRWEAMSLQVITHRSAAGGLLGRPNRVRTNAGDYESKVYLTLNILGKATAPQVPWAAFAALLNI